VLEALRSDKKRKQSALRFVLCDAIGSAVTMPVPWERANAALDSL
jgi:3-dehydroquinate synthetase